MAARVSSMFVRPGLAASDDQPITLDPNLVRTAAPCDSSRIDPSPAAQPARARVDYCRLPQSRRPLASPPAPAD